MKTQHKDLAMGRWARMSICEQMTNIGGEVSRALNWQKKGNPDFSRKAAERALELIDLSLDSIKLFSRIRELARLREAVVDYFWGSNQFSSSEKLWRKYFGHFNYALRKNF
ncbi:MAG: hypothetical protein KKG95_03955 [Candidatus Omnitrophica bacterium]|nr:hypothetical protein [Candidatus Omnitrophota bacterium]MBU1784476.1 hypothetical protein [Candidatus Omnitrophota bacterium]